MASETAEPIPKLISTEALEDRFDDREEAEYIARARRGDAVAINWLLARYRTRVVRLATHVLRRPGDAEDVAQEAFVRAFRNLGSFRQEGRFYTWLYQIVVRLCLDRQRLARWSSEVPIGDVNVRSERAPTDTDAVEARMLVETLLEKLKPTMRAMLVLRELEGLEYEEIALILNIPVGRVKWRLHTARMQFQALWREAVEETEHV